MVGIQKLLILGFLVLTLFSFLPSFKIDQNDWQYWSQRLVENGPANFYSKEVFTDYFPGYLYVFWFIGLVKNLTLPFLSYNSLMFDLLLKLPANLAQLFTAYIIYRVVKKEAGDNLGKIGFILYIFNPALIFSTSVWGQFDTVSTMFMLLTLLLLTRKKPLLATFAFAISFAIKPQALIFLPILGMLFLIFYKPRIWFFSALVFISTTILIYLPFFPTNPINGIFYLSKTMASFYQCTTCFAFNFWGIFGNWQKDTDIFFGLTKQIWGLVLFALFLAVIFLKKPFRQNFKPPFIFLTTSLSILSFFTFMTRMHERYLFPFFAFFLISALLFKSKKLMLFYVLLSMLHLINLFIPYYYYNYQTISFSESFNFLLSGFQLFSFIYTISSVILIYICIKYDQKNS